MTKIIHGSNFELPVGGGDGDNGEPLPTLFSAAVNYETPTISIDAEVEHNIQVNNYRWSLNGQYTDTVSEPFYNFPNIFYEGNEVTLELMSGGEVIETLEQTLCVLEVGQPPIQHKNELVIVSEDHPNTNYQNSTPYYLQSTIKENPSTFDLFRFNQAAFIKIDIGDVLPGYSQQEEVCLVVFGPNSNKNNTGNPRALYQAWSLHGICPNMPINATRSNIDWDEENITFNFRPPTFRADDRSSPTASMYTSDYDSDSIISYFQSVTYAFEDTVKYNQNFLAHFIAETAVKQIEIYGFEHPTLYPRIFKQSDAPIPHNFTAAINYPTQSLAEAEIILNVDEPDFPTAYEVEIQHRGLSTDGEWVTLAPSGGSDTPAYELGSRTFPDPLNDFLYGTIQSLDDRGSYQSGGTDANDLRFRMRYLFPNLKGDWTDFQFINPETPA